MTATTLPTPADLSITPRDRRFGREASQRRACGTVAASKRPQFTTRYRAPFPIGEAYFVESVRAFRDWISSPSSPRRSRLFTTQEAIHSREHDAFNKAARAGAGYDLSKAGSAGREAAGDHPLRGRRSSMSAQPWRSSISPPSWPTSCSRIRTHLEGARSRGRQPVALALGRGDRAQGRRLRHLAVRDARVAAVEAVEDQGESDALRHPQLRRRPDGGVAGADAAGRGDRLFAHGRCCSGTCGCVPGMFRKIAGAWFKFSCPGFHPWNEDDRFSAGGSTKRSGGAAPEDEAQVKKRGLNSILPVANQWGGGSATRLRRGLGRRALLAPSTMLRMVPLPEASSGRIVRPPAPRLRLRRTARA